MAFTGSGSNQPPSGDPVFSVGVPSGAVMHFNLAACPTGWTGLTAARGRYLVGLPSAGTLAGTAGTALTNLENRPVGQHAHTITDPGHAHSLTIFASDQNYITKVRTYDGGPTPLPNFSTATATTSVTVDSTGTVAGTNAPYIQFLVCQKN